MLTTATYNDGEYDNKYNEDNNEFDYNVFLDNADLYCQRCHVRRPASLVYASSFLPEPVRAEVPCGAP